MRISPLQSWHHPRYLFGPHQKYVRTYLRQVHHGCCVVAWRGTDEIKDDSNIIKTTEENKNEIKSGTITQENDYINITENGGIKKRILKEGKGAFPKDGNEVIIDYIGKFNEDIFDHSNENEPFSFTIGENKVAKGLEIAVKTMKLGENSEFIMTPEYTDDEAKKNQNICLFFCDGCLPKLGGFLLIPISIIALLLWFLL